MQTEENNLPTEPKEREPAPGEEMTEHSGGGYSAPAPTLEDQPAEPETKTAETTPAVPEVKKESWLKRTVRWLEVALLFFLIGAALVYVLTTLPAQNQVAALKTDAAVSGQKLDALNAELQTAQDDLAAAQATIQAREVELSSANLKMAVYKMKMDVNTIRVALLRLDTITAAQALAAARDDLNTLAALKVDSATIDGFKKRLDNAAATLNTDAQKSMLELDNLIDNLYLLESNLK
jgi:hypothetical protein